MHIAFCPYAESCCKSSGDFLGQMDVPILFDPILKGHLGPLISNENSHHH